MKKHRRKHSPARRTFVVPAVPSTPSATAPATPPVALDPAKLDLAGYDPDDYDWVPVRRRPRVDGWTIERQRAFIGHLADSGSVLTAARLVGMSASSAYALRRLPGSEGFARAWDSAIRQAAHAVVDAAFERAINGSDEPVYGKDGRVIGRRHRQSDGLMMFIMRKHFPETYGDLGRDRPYESDRAPPVPAVAEAIVAIGPPEPDDPAALLTDAQRANAYLNADFAPTEPVFAEPDDHDEDDLTQEREAELEERLAAIRREADPDFHAALDERHALEAERDAIERELDGERADRRARRRRWTP